MTNIEDTVQLDEAGQYDPAAETALSTDEVTLLRLRTDGPRGVLAVDLLARGEDDTLICVTKPGPGEFWGRFFIGTGSPLREVKVHMMDGRWGRLIETAEGDFTTPEPLGPHGARFAGRPFTLMDAKGLDGVPTPAGLVLR
ncbi:putative protein OS=Tsukamurella paurometabola (strain ATCC 8368 / DSM / CCUG 35730 /CIP 100753 / JCM 10117 / KCTC 9821 / NBRC 16120 / NCIMB 702349/ NCTC 13040) OX=521096 GN=Tpau_4302 PE=4 SV=1 [Tsukamurella paurometabola]|uniref:Uncharacterized protein n=1 Tax=Tsukamurella paurometabola (strain ATCC 8368 / DSM 20162 / CCUG 35730 / CIP 100753 / JCM 10117 / KCTC 9821 / NBRC 16120 / NCIMB 702349 / NCTC 13040) TaxID=521096 RepID=D5UZ21_TSUPD|nr:hypothetical protein [Tsukamurella paurometabola]ADG80868.1 hypothetical protein Tpau_4302 [Tsukamurella paurometabola DSM 20162]SUQ39227.1 Uncharacterised protein [Tsukamurella paurometabola]